MKNNRDNLTKAVNILVANPELAKALVEEYDSILNQRVKEPSTKISIHLPDNPLTSSFKDIVNEMEELWEERPEDFESCLLTLRTFQDSKGLQELVLTITDTDNLAGTEQGETLISYTYAIDLDTKKPQHLTQYEEQSHFNNDDKDVEFIDSILEKFEDLMTTLYNM